MNRLYDMVKKTSGYERWAGRTAGPLSRHHHLVAAPPELAGNFRVATVSHPPGAEPARDWQIWNIADARSGEAVFVVHLFEYDSPAETHQALLNSLMSITMAGADYAPVPGGPGDILILTRMARDNLLVTLAEVKPDGNAAGRSLLQAIDQWLLSDWPLAAGKAGGKPANPLDVELQLADHRSPEAAALKAREPLPLAVAVKGPQQIFAFDRLPHQLTAPAGIIKRQDDIYLFTASQPGEAAVAVSILGPAGEPGQAQIVLKLTGN